MPEFVYPSAAYSLADLIWQIDKHGQKVAPRRQMTKEIQGVIIVIEDPTDCLVYGVERKINPRLAALEALQLIAGRSYPELMRRVAPQTAQFMDGQVFHGAYGPRLRRQLMDVFYRLARDPDSRQGVATVWDPAHDGDGWQDTRDTPCTVYLNFMIRNGRLDLHTHMRSNDVWFGWPYDVTQFCALQVSMAQAVNCSPGAYRHFVDSLHLYEKDVDDASRIVPPQNEEERPKIAPVASLAVPGWGNQVTVARNLLDGADASFSGAVEGDWLTYQARKIHGA